MGLMLSAGTKLKEFVGSVVYMAPSVIKRSYGPEADVWSLGIILHALLGGTPPFLGTDDEVMKKIIHDPLDLTKGRWKYVSNGAKSLVLQLLEKDDSKRITLPEVLGNFFQQTPRFYPFRLFFTPSSDFSSFVLFSFRALLDQESLLLSTFGNFHNPWC